MEFLKKSKVKILMLVGGFVIVGLVFVLILAKWGFLGQKARVVADKIRVRKDGQLVTFSKDKVVEFKDENGVFYQVWEAEDGSSLYDYFKDKIESGLVGASGKYFVSWDGKSGYLGDDGVLDEVFSGPGEGSWDGGDDEDNFFNFGVTPTPTPTKKPSSGGTSGGKGIDDCPFWRLSYCVWPYATPTPTPSTPAPEILPPECEQNRVTGRTVIGDELCVETPTPSP